MTNPDITRAPHMSLFLLSPLFAAVYYCTNTMLTHFLFSFLVKRVNFNTTTSWKHTVPQGSNEVSCFIDFFFSDFVLHYDFGRRGLESGSHNGRYKARFC
jgi:hypothetical protein